MKSNFSAPSNLGPVWWSPPRRSDSPRQPPSHLAKEVHRFLPWMRTIPPGDALGVFSGSSLVDGKDPVF